jgi:sugar lactone lactonase YvrE
MSSEAMVYKESCSMININKYSSLKHKIIVTIFIFSVIVMLPSISEGREKYEFLNEWGDRGTKDGEFNSPSTIAIDQSGNIYVTDTDNNRIQKFTHDGKFLAKWGTKGIENVQFDRPSGIAVDSAGNVYVADTYNNRIQKFKSNGEFITKWGVTGSGDGQFNQPGGIAIDALSNIYVADSYNNRIQKFNPNGGFLTKWGTRGREDGQFDKPLGITVSSSGYVYVADTQNDRIQKFTAYGAFIVKWGKYGTGNGEFSSPYGVAVDISGNVYITDSGNNRMQKFNSEGTFITKFGKLGHDGGTFSEPYGSIIDTTGYVFITDSRNDRIQVFKRSSTGELPVANSQTAEVYEDSSVMIILTGRAPYDDPITFKLASQPSNGSLSSNPPSLTYTPKPNFNGEDKFTFTVSDGIDESQPATVTMKVIPVNDSPIANSQSLEMDEDNNLSITLSGNDIDGDKLTYRIVNPPLQGTLDIAAIPKVIYTPKNNYYGNDTFVFLVNDGTVDSNQATISIKVNPVPDPPKAISASVTIREDTPINIKLTGDDPDNDPITFEILKNPKNGKLIGSPPIITYEPNENFNGKDSFQFTTNDGTFKSLPATIDITIEPVNDPPKADSQSVEVNEDEKISINLTGSDVDGDPITFKLRSSPINGKLEGTIPQLIYIPNADFFGEDSFTFSVNDGNVDSEIASVSIKVKPVPDQPKAIPQKLTTKEDVDTKITLTGVDPDRDALTFKILSYPKNGKLQGTPPELIYIPNKNFSGTDSFSFSVSDGIFTSDPAEVTIFVENVNDPPVAIPQSVKVDEDSEVEIILTGTDPDNDNLKYRIIRYSKNCTITGTPPKVIYKPNPHFFGNDSFDFTVSDGILESSPATVSIEVRSMPDPPIAIAQSVVVDEDTNVKITLTGDDYDGDIISFRVTNLPSNGTLSGTAPDLIYTPKLDFFGQDSFDFMANDGMFDSQPAKFSIIVNPIPDPPVAKPLELNLNEDASIDLTLIGQDPDDDKLIFSITNEPKYGSLSGTAPSLKYTPKADFFGKDSFTYNIFDGMFTSDSAIVSFEVNPVPDPPVADSKLVIVNEDHSIEIVLTGSDPDGDVIKFNIVSSPKNGDLRGTPPNLTYTPKPEFNGDDSFTFSIYDGIFDSNVAVVSIIVRAIDDPPIAKSQSVTLDEDNLIKITLEGEDPEGKPVRFRIINPPLYGSMTGTPPDLVYKPNPDFFGKDSFTFAVNDGVFDSITPATVEITVNPQPDPPSAKSLSFTIDEDKSVSITLIGHDPDNDVLTYKIIDGPKNGIISGTPPVLSYLPTQYFNGKDSFIYLVSDGIFDSKQATVDITIRSILDPPIAYPQTLKIDEDQSINITLTGSDPDGDVIKFQIMSYPKNGNLSGAPPNLVYTPKLEFNGMDSFTFFVNDGTFDSKPVPVNITVRAVNDPPIAEPQSITLDEDISKKIILKGRDPEGSSINFKIVNNPSNGILEETITGLTYTPYPNFFGNDSFTFVANDGELNSELAMVNIKVNPIPDPPVAESILYTLDEDTSIKITLTGTDPDGDKLTFKVVSNPEHGQLNGKAPDLTYIPDANFNGDDEFTFIANDGIFDSNPINIKLKINSSIEPPIAYSQELPMDEDTKINISLKGYDVDGDKITFVVISKPTNGVLSGNPPNLIYTPKENYNGVDSFSFAANDEIFTSNTAKVTLNIRPIPDPPIAHSQLVFVDEDQKIRIILAGEDPDGDQLKFKVESDPANGVLDGTPPDLTYTPILNFNGGDRFTFSVSDGLFISEPAEVSITIKPVNDPPFAISQTITLDEDTSINITLTGTDIDGDNINFRIVSNPQHGFLGGVIPNITYTPNPDFFGYDKFTFVASDGQLDSEIAVVELIINNIPDPPIAEPQNVTVDEDNSLNIKLTGRDPDGDSLTFKVTEFPRNGQLKGNPPNLVYMPTQDYFGVDSFKFIAYDGMFESQPASINVKVNPINDKPIAILKDITGIQRSDVKIGYNLVDPEKEGLDITCEYRKVGEKDWHKASVAGKINSITNYDGEIIWNSSKDIPSSVNTVVQFRITPKDSEIGTYGVTKEFTLQNLLGDFDSDGNIDFEDMMQLSKAWDANDISKDIGPAKGTPPELEPMLDKNLDFEDLGVFIVMWNWSHSNIQPQTPPFDSAMDIEQEMVFKISNSSESSQEQNIAILNPEQVFSVSAIQINIQFEPDKVRILKVSKGELQSYNDSSFPFLTHIDSRYGLLEIETCKLSLLENIDLKPGAILSALQIERLANIDTNILLNFKIYNKLNQVAISKRSILHLDARRIPDKTIAMQNYPNPFNSETWIPFQLENDNIVRLDIFSGNGELIRTINLGQKNAGYYLDRTRSAYWDGKNNNGEETVSGIYFYVLTAGNLKVTKKMVIMR